MELFRKKNEKWADVDSHATTHCGTQRNLG